MAGTIKFRNTKPPVVKKFGKSEEFDPGEPVAHLVSPEGAVFVQRAEGEFADKVAIAGFSGSNFGVFASSATGTGLFAAGGAFAAEFDGPVRIGSTLDIGDKVTCSGHMHVEGDITLRGADYAEDFDIAAATLAEPGTVMVLDDAGGLRACDIAYDRRVAGVVSGAGGFSPAVILDRSRETEGRRPLALMGKVYCKADASAGPIAVGDLLTTSATPGHAMKAADPARAAGAVIGKALRPLAEGHGLVPILVSLQ